MIDWLKLYQWFEKNMNNYLWGLFIGSLILGNVNFAILAVLLLIYNKIDQIKFEINIVNNIDSEERHGIK